VERGWWKDRGRVRAYPRNCDLQFVFIAAAHTSPGFKAGIVPLMSERTDDLRKRSRQPACPLRCDVEYCRNMPASDRSWDGWRLLQKVLHADRRNESRLAHMGLRFDLERVRPLGVWSTEIMSYTCSIVHRDASSGASKSRIEFISPASACASFPNL
jgi:hypothetical protein